MKITYNFLQLNKLLVNGMFKRFYMIRKCLKNEKWIWEKCKMD